MVIRAKNTLETAWITLKEYVEGRYEQQKQTVESSIFAAQEDHILAQQYLEFEEGLLAKGYVTTVKIQEDRFAVERAFNDWEIARMGLKVLEDYTKPKIELSLRAAIKTAVANLKSEENKHQLNLNKLDRIRKQIDKCTIRAPAAGQVVYAHETNWWGQPIFIEEGNVVREKQTFIRLPDPARMQVKAKIHEATLALVQKGMKARIHIDALKDLELTGKVQKINEYPAVSSSPFGTSVKEYETTIEIDKLPADETGEPLELRPGMTAEVKILVQTLPNVIQAPVEAVLEHDRKYYCVQPSGESFRLRRVTLGSSNDKTVVILEGLEVGEQIVMAAAPHRDELDLPEAPPEQPQFAQQASAEPGDAK